MCENSLRLLGLARKARLLEIGEEPVSIACRASRARLLMLAKDSAEHTVRRAGSFCRSGKPLMLMLPFTKDELGSALGCNACAMCAFTDAAFAKSFVESLDPGSYDSAVLQELSRQTERIIKRRNEQRAHRNNVKHGRK